MFQDTFALKMNPFGPTFPAAAENLSRLPFLTNLDRRPLRLDQCADLLEPLFCGGILDIDAHMTKFHRLMRRLGYQFSGNPARSMQSALIVIRGAIGSGKTTLGARMIADMARLPGKPFACFYVPDHAQDTDNTRVAALDGLHDKIAAIPAGNHVAALVENVSEASLKAAVSRFNMLENWPRLFVLTTHNLKLLDADERTMAGEATIEVFTLRNVTPDDAEAYVKHRLPQYRDPRRSEIEDLSSVFPFRPGQAGRYVQGHADKGAVPIVLRQLNTRFGEMLTEHADKLRLRPGLVPVVKAEAAALEDYLLPED
jgi:hypothetical protein